LGTKTLTRTERIEVSIPIHVFGTKPPVPTTPLEGRTAHVSRFGATIVLPRELASGQGIRLRLAEGGRDALARNAGLISRNGEWRTYGVVFVKPNGGFWGVDVPDHTECEDTESDALLECAACRARETVHLNDIETEVFKARGIVTLPCGKCAHWTVWALAPHESSAIREAPAARKSSLSPKRQTVNRRKHIRVPTKVMACIRCGGVREEVVRVKDASRGGFRFVSEAYYTEETNITVAVPYARDAANVFVSARIKWRRELRQLDRREYGVEYADSPKTRSTAS